MKNIGQKLANIRKDSGLNQQELAKAVKRSSSYISRIESGERFPTPELIYQILKVCKQNAGWTEDEYQKNKKEFEFDLENLKSIERDIPPLLDNQPINYGNYTGNYYLYKFPTSGGDIPTVNKVQIKDFRGSFFVSVENIRRGRHFEGQMLLNEHNIFWNLNMVNFSEKIFCVFYNPISRVIERLWGIATETSYMHEPSATIVLLTKDFIRESEVGELFKQNGYDKKSSTLKILRNNAGLFPRELNNDVLTEQKQDKQ